MGRHISQDSSVHEEDDEDSGDDGQQGLFGALRGLFAPNEPSSGSGAAAVVEDEEEAEEPTTNLEGLYEYFEELKRDGVRLTETTYIVNKWALGGIIPMTHHGFCFKTSAGDYFSLDFSRKGIVWDTYGDEIPGLPDNTTLVQTYRIDVDPQTVRRYCEETKPFQWLRNDCDTWSQGMMMVLGITKDNRKQRQVCGVDEEMRQQGFSPLSSCSAPTGTGVGELNFTTSKVANDSQSQGGPPQAPSPARAGAGAATSKTSTGKTGHRRQRTGDCL
jgi:hypothetical protein